MTTLNYDANGFIVGINRMKDGIDNVHDDTQEIIQILKSQNQISNTRMRELTRAVKSANYRSESQASASASRTRSNLLDRQPRISSSASTDSDNTRNRNRASNRSTVSRNSSSAADRNRNTTNSNSEDTGSNRRSSSTTRRERDANGRFISDSNESKRGFGLSGLSGMGRSDVSGVDPLIDSLREAKDLLSPIGRAGKLAGRAAKFSWSKFKSMKRREPLSNDETRHNRENEKLLDKIWKAIRRTGGNGNGGGLLGGLLPFGLGRNRPGGGGGILGKLKNIFKGVGGIKGLGLLATVASSASLAMDWGNLNHEQKSEGVGGIGGAMAGGAAGAALGATIGSVIPGLGTAIGGVVGGLAGAWLGSEAGQELGRVASPYIQSWTKKLIDYNLPEKILSVWKDGIKPFFLSFMHKGQEAGSWLGGGFNGGKVKRGEGFPKSGDGGDGDISAGVTQKANKAADIITKNALTKSSGYCAKYVRKGLQEAGYDLKTMGDAKNYNNGAMQAAGFSVIDSKSAPQKGDVMVMPAQGGHGAGHMQTYNGQQWVSDFKQNSKNPWNDVATENLKYTMYRDQKGAMSSGKASQGKGGGAKTKQAMDYFMSQGWTKEQAAGIVGNLHKESGGFRDDVIQGKESGRGDGGKAVGIGQWHAPRQKDFKNKFGKSIVGSTFEDQLAFTNFELTKGKEQAAGDRLKKAKTAEQAGAIVSEFYERPADTQGENRERGQMAANIAKNYGVTSNNAAKNPNANISKKSAGKPLLKAQGYAPVNLPTAPVLKIPDAIKIKERLDSGGGNKPMMLQSSNDTIHQNLSDRGLAHAVTGGFGQDRMWG